MSIKPLIARISTLIILAVSSTYVTAQELPAEIRKALEKQIVYPPEKLKCAESGIVLIDVRDNKKDSLLVFRSEINDDFVVAVKKAINYVSENVDLSKLLKGSIIPIYFSYTDGMDKQHCSADQILFNSFNIFSTLNEILRSNKQSYSPILLIGYPINYKRE